MVERLRGPRLAASIAVYAVAAVLLAIRLGGPYPVLALGVSLAVLDPLLASIYLEVYAAAGIAWGAHPKLADYLIAVAPLAALAPPSILGALTAIPVYAGFIAASLYILAVVQRLTDPATWPPLMRIVLAPLVSNPFAVWLAVTISSAVVVIAARRLSEPIASSISPRYATLLAREWLLEEAERIRNASTWYHRLLAWSLGLLATLPIVFVVNAFIAALYAAVSIYAPSPRIREALQLARGAISTTVFWATGWIFSRSIRRMLRGEWNPAPSKIAPIILAAAALAAAILYRDAHTAMQALTCILVHCPPQAVPLSPLDSILSQALRSTWEMLEATEDMLRFLIRLFWS